MDKNYVQLISDRIINTPAGQHNSWGSVTLPINYIYRQRWDNTKMLEQDALVHMI